MYDLHNISLIDLTDRRQIAYNADMTWILASMISGLSGSKNFDVVSPSRNLQDNIERFTVREDSRSGKQIIQTVYNKMKQIAQRGG